MSKYLILESIVANLPQLILLVFVFLFRLKSKASTAKSFFGGIFIIILADFLMGPYSSWLALKYMDVIGSSGLYISLAAIPMNILKAIGLLMCMRAYIRITI